MFANYDDTLVAKSTYSGHKCINSKNYKYDSSYIFTHY